MIRGRRLQRIQRAFAPEIFREIVAEAGVAQDVTHVGAGDAVVVGVDAVDTVVADDLVDADVFLVQADDSSGGLLVRGWSHGDGLGGWFEEEFGHSVGLGGWFEEEFGHSVGLGGFFFG